MTGKKRFQIYLTPRHKELLDEESRLTGKTIAELIRQALDEFFGDNQ